MTWDTFLDESWQFFTKPSIHSKVIVSIRKPCPNSKLGCSRKCQADQESNLDFPSLFVMSLSTFLDGIQLFLRSLNLLLGHGYPWKTKTFWWWAKKMSSELGIKPRIPDSRVNFCNESRHFPRPDLTFFEWSSFLLGGGFSSINLHFWCFETWGENCRS